MVVYRCIFCGAEARSSKEKAHMFPARKGAGIRCRACGAVSPVESRLLVKVDKEIDK